METIKSLFLRKYRFSANEKKLMITYYSIQAEERRIYMSMTLTSEQIKLS